MPGQTSQPTLQPQVSLRPLNTFKVEAQAAYYAEVTRPGELEALFADPRVRDLPCLVLGGGSNTLFTRDFDGLVLKNTIRGIRVVDEDAHAATLEAGGGEAWQNLVDFALERRLAGIENLTHVPGTVGAAPVQNISAYGQSFADVFVSLDACDLATGAAVTFAKAGCRLGYRDSFFKREGKGRYLITRVRVRLAKQAGLTLGYQSRYDSLAEELAQLAQPPYTLEDISAAIARIRARKFPDLRLFGTAGSFFTNPVVSQAQLERIQRRVPGVQTYPAAQPGQVKVPAGWLLDALGWKGRRMGNVGTSPNQALVIVNHGGATGPEILAFARQMQADFERAYGVWLEPEVNIF